MCMLNQLVNLQKAHKEQLRMIAIIKGNVYCLDNFSSLEKTSTNVPHKQ